MENQTHKKTFGTAPVFFTAISTILGAILFLRFGYAVGTLGFVGVLLIVFLGHMVTIPTALSISEIATNQRVEGGGEYFIISRSFGLNIGATIGIALFFSQAISVAFYVIAFTEAFEPIFNFVYEKWGVLLPRQIISIPSMLLLSYLILKRGANMGVKALYFVVAILFLALLLFFLGKTDYSQTETVNLFTIKSENFKNFFIVFAICFPAFTGMTAGVGLSGDLKNPGKSIPLGTTIATITGMIMYVFISLKLAVSAHPDELVNNQLIMSKIAVFGPVIIPLGLAASTISSAIGSIMVAPRTLQALGIDRSIPLPGINHVLAKGKGETHEPFNATVVTCIIALVFVALGDVNAVAQIISMFFMVTYGSLCLISFLYHFGADPSYRPAFRSKWYVSLVGFVLCFWLMFKMNTTYALASIIVISLIYTFVSYSHKDRGGMQAIFQSAIFQLSRNIQVFNQKTKKSSEEKKWRPAVICISSASFERNKAIKLLNWISFRYGFGTYIHLIEDYFSTASSAHAKEVLNKLIELSEENSKIYLDTLISPSYTSAVAQVIQLPSISGLENNMMLFEFDKNNPHNLKQITDNIALARAADMDICVLGASKKSINFKQGIHVWIKSIDFENANLMILLSYIILGHPDWKKGKIKIFSICKESEFDETRNDLLKLIQVGRLPISSKNIEIIKQDENVNSKSLVAGRSEGAGLTVIGFHEDQIKYNRELFLGYHELGDVLFVNARDIKEIK
ncbi:MAG: amino acid permease [Bacteroidales bacterium]|nr:amino acid permease [Bacteroidales bacterium]